MIRILVGDITTLDVVVIVNAANTSLLGGGGVDGAIHRAAGPGLREECRALGGCATGDAKITAGHGLRAQYVLHTVGPVWRGGREGEPALLERCYRRCFEIALDRRLSSIAFPAISTGAFGFPGARAAAIALGVMNDYEDRFDEIIACCFREDDAEFYRSLCVNP